MSNYLKDIKIHIDNRIISTDINGQAFINKVPKGIQNFSIIKDGYLPINSNINVPLELTKDYRVQIVNNSYQITATPDTAIINLKRTTINGEIFQMQYIGQTPIINGSFGDKVEYTIEKQNYDTITGSFYLNNPAQNGSNTKNIIMTLSKGTLNIVVQDINGTGVAGVNVIINNQTLVTDENGYAVLENVFYGSYQYTVTGDKIVSSYSSVAQLDSSENTVYATVERKFNPPSNTLFSHENYEFVITSDITRSWKKSYDGLCYGCVVYFLSGNTRYLQPYFVSTDKNACVWNKSWSIGVSDEPISYFGQDWYYSLETSAIGAPATNLYGHYLLNDGQYFTVEQINNGDVAKAFLNVLYGA